ncbi:MAG: DUF4445 domain-containing protein [Desulfobacterales bacterium]|nr:DUF4445 domain-containing protein [Desulfobacterales bacterium]
MKLKLKANEIDFDYSVVKNISNTLRQSDFSISCLLFKERTIWKIIDIFPCFQNRSIFGIAIDLGTTNIVLRLIDITQNRVISEISFYNPQITIGPDILTRIHYADDKKGLNELNSILIDGINEKILALCQSEDIDKTNIYGVAVAGNTAMTHLFLGITPRWLIREPYIPVINNPGTLNAKNIGLDINQKAVVFVFPNIGSYFGGDLISGIIYSGIYKKEEISILVDVGTNAEVVLGNKDWLIACAGAAGPALESGVSKIGMMAEPGVIDKIKINQTNYEFDIRTIGNFKPKGICGSGIIDLAAQLFFSGMIDIRGKFKEDVCKNKLKNIDGINHLIIVPSEKSATHNDLTISQIDIDSLIRSKAAMYTILETIILYVGIDFTDISKFYVAGTFGAYIDPVSAITIGMLPDLPIEKYVSIGNSSLSGAAIALQDWQLTEDIYKIRDSITYLELNVNQEFMNRFSAAKFIPHTDTSRFPSLKL